MTVAQVGLAEGWQGEGGPEADQEVRPAQTPCCSTMFWWDGQHARDRGLLPDGSHSHCETASEHQGLAAGQTPTGGSGQQCSAPEDRQSYSENRLGTQRQLPSTPHRLS